MFPKNSATKMLVQCAMLTALEIILNRFCSINAWNLKIGVSFIAPACAAMLYGAPAAVCVWTVSDLLGALLFPSGPFFPGFTLSAFLSGLLYGCLLHRKQDLPHILAAVLIQQVFVSLLLNTGWISMLYGSPFRGVFMTRLMQTGILIPVQTAGLFVLGGLLKRAGGVLRNSGAVR